MGFNDHEEIKQRPKTEKPEEKLIKNQECVSCKKMYECKGKLRSVTQCSKYEERKGEK